MPGIKREIPFRQVLANLGAAAGNYVGAVSDDEGYEDFAVIDAILNTEARILHNIAESFFNGNRTNESGLTDIITTKNVANGALVPRHIGPIIGVEIDGIPAEICAASEVGRLRSRNVLNLGLQDALYGLEDNRLYFTSGTGASTAKVFVFEFARPTFISLAAFKASDSPLPGEYQQCWVDLATGAVMPREGDLIQSANAYILRGEKVLGELMGENRPRSFTRDAQRSGI